MNRNCTGTTQADTADKQCVSLQSYHSEGSEESASPSPRCHSEGSEESASPVPSCRPQVASLPEAMTGERVPRLRCAPLRTTDNDRQSGSFGSGSAQDDRLEAFPSPGSALRVLYCDRDILVCEKPAGVLSEPGPGANLPALAGQWLTARGEAPTLRTVHRLDRAVGGLTVLARTQKAAASLIAQIEARTVEKEYLAVLRGVPEAGEAALEDLLFHDSRSNKSFVVTRPRKGVREAKLSYRVVGRAEGETGPLSLVRIRLHTGRTHQIRVQFSHRGLPLLGDLRYGSRASHGPALFACRLAFDHPATGKRMKFELLPTGEPWDLFAEPQQHTP